jgi:hypothetical protein
MPLKIRKNLERFILSSWRSQGQVGYKEKLQRISSEWGEKNPKHKVGSQTLRSFAVRLRLVKKNMPKSERSALDKFILENWEGRTSDELSRLWSSKSVYPINNLQAVRVLKRLGLKISCSEMRKINEMKKKEQQIIASNKDSIKSLEEKIRANRIKLMKSRIDQNKDIFTGMEMEQGVLAEIARE